MDTAPNYKRPESVLIVVHSSDGMILLLKRADVPDFWQSVTGSLEWGEAPDRAARRELFEETGIDEVSALLDWKRSVNFEILSQFKDRYTAGTKYNLEHMFSLQTQVDRPIVLDPSEHEAYEWRPHPEALDLVWSWSNRDAIRAVADKYWR